jgi:murein DD-endopeptidase MepM/ murein hydrolase activator NlpD
VSGQARQTCDRCGASNAAGAEFCVSPHCRTYLGWDRPEPAAEPAPAPAPAPETAPDPEPKPGVPSLRVEVADPVLAVEPGRTAATTVTVRNLGRRVEQVAVGVVGLPGRFAAVDPPALTVHPGTAATCAVRFSPPRSPACPAGHLGYGVRAGSGPDTQVAAGATVVVAAYTDLTVELAPQATRTRLRGVQYLTLTNNGNTVQRVHLSAADPEHALRFELDRSPLDLPPGRFAVPVAVRARPAVAGPAVRRTFDVAVSDAGGAVLARATGTRITPAWLPPWLLVALAILASLALLGSGVNAVLRPASSDAPAPAGGPAAPGAGPAPGAKAPGAKAPARPASGAPKGLAAAGRWIRPVPGAIVSGFRAAERPDHDGVDLGAPRGTVIRAASAGIVVTVLCNVDGRFFAPDTGPVPCDSDGSPGLGGCGWYVEIRHAAGVLSRYCHMVRQPAVHVGQSLPIGQPVGLVGTSGNSSGPHLHLEIHVADQPVDPVPFLAARGVRL